MSAAGLAVPSNSRMGRDLTHLPTEPKTLIASMVDSQVKTFLARSTNDQHFVNSLCSLRLVNREWASLGDALQGAPPLIAAIG